MATSTWAFSRSKSFWWWRGDSCSVVMLVVAEAERLLGWQWSLMHGLKTSLHETVLCSILQICSYLSSCCCWSLKNSINSCYHIISACSTFYRKYISLEETTFHCSPIRSNCSYHSDIMRCSNWVTPPSSFSNSSSFVVLPYLHAPPSPKP